MPIHIRLTVEDRPGVLDRITGLIRRNGLNISEINAGERGDGTSCINILIKDKGADIHTLGKALTQLECVKGWEELNEKRHYTREALLFSVCSGDYKEGMFQNAQLMEQNGDILIFAYLAASSEVDSMLAANRNLLCDYSRGGALGVRKGGDESK